MSAFFGVGGNPFASPVGQKIEQATDGSLASENWALNMEICDIINETEDGPKDAIKAIRKRLQQAAGKNYTIVMYTLTVLETCVKNCGKKFHVLVCSKEFISELVKLIGPKNEPPTAVQDKILSLIQSWADAFYQQSEMAGVMQVYQELRLKGIEFPMTDLDSMAPIHTPQKSIKEASVTDSPVCRGPTSDGRASPVAPVAAVGSVPPLSQEQSAKLYRELEIMQINMTVFGEMLNELTPGSEHPADWQLLQELNSTCKEMQERLVELVSKLPSDEVTAELLRINDLLNNLFLRYGRYENNREAGLNIKDGDSARTTAKTPTSLIDLSDEVTPAQQITTQMAGLGIGGQLASLNTVDAQSGTLSPQKNEKEDSEFDMFAQSRNLTYESSKAGGSTYESNRKPDQVSGSLAAVAEARAQGTQNTAAATMHKESDFDEMAAWLGDSAGTEESLTSSEFERFLAERAAAAEALPPTTNTQSRPSPKKNNKDSEDAAMFAL